VQEEIEANQFAAELLMPEKQMRACAASLHFDLSDPADDKKALRALRDLAKRFQVSVQALSFRMANLTIA
jgi:Zn-dependent peptidase ImmA (M78 family)